MFSFVFWGTLEIWWCVRGFWFSLGRFSFKSQCRQWVDPIYEEEIGKIPFNLRWRVLRGRNNETPGTFSVCQDRAWKLPKIHPGYRWVLVLRGPKTLDRNLHHVHLILLCLISSFMWVCQKIQLLFYRHLVKIFQFFSTYKESLNVCDFLDHNRVTVVILSQKWQ